MGLFTKRTNTTMTVDEISDGLTAEGVAGGSAQSSADDRVVEEMDAALSAEEFGITGPIDDVADEEVTQQFQVPAPVSAVAVAPAVASAAEPAPDVDVATLSDDELAPLVRTRLANRDTVAHLATDYAAPIAGDLVALLQIDRADRVEIVTDDMLAGRDIDALFAAGLTAIMDEPTDQVQQAAPGIALFVGQTPSFATKVLGMQQLIADHLPAAHHGVLFGVPNRHLVFAVALTDMASLQNTGALAELVADQAGVEDNPGGTLSSDVYLWRADQIERVCGMDETGAVHMYGGFLMQDVLEELSATA